MNYFQKITMSIIVLISLVLGSSLVCPYGNEFLKSPFNKECDTLAVIAVEINTEIPMDTIVTPFSAQMYVDKIAKIIESYGYSEKEYGVRAYLINPFVFQIDCIIKYKTNCGAQRFFGRYRFSLYEV